MTAILVGLEGAEIFHNQGWTRIHWDCPTTSSHLMVKNMIHKKIQGNVFHAWKSTVNHAQWLRFINNFLGSRTFSSAGLTLMHSELRQYKCMKSGLLTFFFRYTKSNLEIAIDVTKKKRRKMQKDVNKLNVIVYQCHWNLTSLFSHKTYSSFFLFFFFETRIHIIVGLRIKRIRICQNFSWRFKKKPPIIVIGMRTNIIFDIIFKNYQ